MRYGADSLRDATALVTLLVEGDESGFVHLVNELGAQPLRAESSIAALAVYAKQLAVILAKSNQTAMTPDEAAALSDSEVHGDVVAILQQLALAMEQGSDT